MPLKPIERKAELAKAATLREHKLEDASRECGASYVHIRECLAGNRLPSFRLAAAVAEYCGFSLDDFWGAHVAPEPAARAS